MNKSLPIDLPPPNLSRVYRRTSDPHRNRAVWLLEFCQTDFPKTKGEKRKKWCEGLGRFSGVQNLRSVNVEMVWRDLKRKLESLRQGHPWPSATSTHLTLQRDGNIIKGDARFEWNWGLARVDDQAVIALSEVAGLLAICGNTLCERFFIRKSRQAYCSSKCRDTVNKRAYRNRRKNLQETTVSPVS